MIVLAAGRGQRMGGPKALLLLDGMPLVELHVSRALEAGVEEVVVVASPDVAPRLLSLRAGLTVATSEAPDPFGSLAVGLGRLAPEPEDEDVVLVTPVDVLPARVETFAALLGAIEAGAPAAVPVHEGRGGHPVALGRRALAIGGASTLREVLARAGATRVAVDDPRVVTDLDTPDDVVALTGAPPAFFR